MRWTLDSETEGADGGAVDALCWDPKTADVVTLLNGEVRSVSGATGQVTWTWTKSRWASQLELESRLGC